MPKQFKESKGLDQLLIPKKSKIDLATMDPRDASKVGASMGGAIGFHTSGPIGAVVGALMGNNLAHATRGIRKGEIAYSNKMKTISDYLNSMGISPMEGDLPNMAVNPLTGEKTRDAYDLDKTNPLTDSAKKAADLFSSIVGRGRLGMVDSDNIDKTILSKLSNNFTNKLLESSKTEQDVIKSSRDMANKLGIKSIENINKHLAVNTFSPEDRENITNFANKLFSK